MIRQATANDLQQWLEVAREVEPLFGPMADEPSFHQALQAAISAGAAWCATEGDRAAGFMVIDPASNEIAWLAVRATCRGQGLGRALIAQALALLDAHRDLRVQTFAPGVPGGAAARKLYLDAGFTDQRAAGPNPAGVETVIMVRRGES